MGYDLALLDLDGTLIDFEMVQEMSYKNTVESFGYSFEKSDCEKYSKANDKYWKLFENKEVTKQELEIGRFKDFLREVKFDIDPSQMNEKYKTQLAANKRFCFFEDAEELCRKISQTADIIIATNGSDAMQIETVNASPIAPFINAIAVSESAGAAKPDRKFFEYALSLGNVKDKAKIIIIGDSLSADISGGINFGIDTCWFNPDNKPLPNGIKPTYTVTNLLDIGKLF